MSTNAPTASPFTALPGAVGHPVPEHYGNPLGEQRALAEGRANVDLSHRGVLTVTGPDRLTWLDSLTSQSLASLSPGESAETLLLDPSGRVEFAARLIDDGETAWLLLDRDEAHRFGPWLDRMRFMLRVEVADRSNDVATIGSLGAPDLPALAPRGIPLVWRDPWVSVVPGGHQYAQTDTHPGHEWSYTETLIARSELEVAAAHPAAGTIALEALRIAAWRPQLATEGDDRTIPHELDWLRSAVHLSKGCYRGQETVAKVHNLGHPPRRLVMLHLDGSDAVLPSAGDPVAAGEAVVGHVTSAAIHYELGPIALAVIKRSVDPSAQLSVTSSGVMIAAGQEVIVPPTAGAEANVPRLPRLGAVRR